MNRAFIALGSNLNSPRTQVELALETLRAHPGINLHSVSSWYGSKAVGPGNQPDYINGTAELQTSLTPETLLDVLQDIELTQGRIRTQRWSARTLDLDMLWYNGEVIDTPRLCVPHPRLCERNFVLLPLNDLAPDLLINGKTVRTYLENVSTNGIWKL